MPVYLDTSKHRTPLGTYPEISVDDSWPEPHHAARDRDELAQRIVDYVARWNGHENFPPSPWDERTGTISLIPPDVVRPASDEVPRYRVKELAAFVGPNLYTTWQEVSYPSWPDHPHQLEAANQSAELVLAYMAKHAAGQKLTGLVHQSGKLNFPNPALRGSPISPTLRWAGAAR